MRHPLNGLLRFSVPDADRQAILGDLEEEFRARVRPARSWIGAHAWYAGQIVAAAWSFRGKRSGGTSAEPRRHRRPLDAGDLRYAVRRWRRRPGFPLTAALTLGLGIGASTAMFSVVDAVLLRPLPWPEPDRLVTMHMVYPERRDDRRFATTWNRTPLHYPAWDALGRGTSFAGVAVWQPPTLGATFDPGKTQLALTMRVSSNFLPMLGVGVIHGRHFGREDDERDTWNVILSYEAWQQHFGGRPEIVGQASTLAYATNTTTPPWTVIGVLEPGFSFEGSKPQALQGIGGHGRQSFFNDLRSLARLAPEATPATAAVEAETLVRASQPDADLSVRVLPVLDDMVGGSAGPLWLLFGAAGVLLLVACANVAGLLVGEHRARRPEIAIRLALGATRGGILRQLVVEHALLALGGAAAGLVLSGWLTQALVKLAPGELPRIDTVAVDWRVALFALVAGGVTLLIFGLTPAWSLAGTRASATLAERGREVPGRDAAQRVVVAAEIALAAVLVVGAGLLGETLFRLISQPLGFDPSNLVVVTTRFTGSDVPANWPRGTRGPGGTGAPALNSGPPLGERMAAARMARTAAAVDRLSAIPGIAHATASSGPLFSGGADPAGARIDVGGRSLNAEDRAVILTVFGSFARTVGVRVLSGRDLAVSDERTTALVSREFERRYFPDGAVGRQFAVLREIGTPPVVVSSVTHEIVGVVPDMRQSYATTPGPRVYRLGEGDSFLLRTGADTESVLPSVRAVLAEVNPQLLVTGVTTVTSTLSDVIAAERFRATLSTAFAGVALVLAAVGLYGVSARRVADRRRELGIRVALGARPANLRALVLQDGLLTVATGLGVGLPLAFAAAGATRAFLFGVSPTAPHVFLLASLALGVVAVAATYVPARRASRVDPIGALRE